MDPRNSKLKIYLKTEMHQKLRDMCNSYLLILLDDAEPERRDEKLQQANAEFLEWCDAKNPVDASRSYGDLCYYKKACGRRGNPAGQPYYGLCDLCFCRDMYKKLLDHLKCD
jgi:hypothetical protein